MRIKEIVENRVTNYHMGMGRERPQDQRILEKNRTRKTGRERRLKDHIGYNIGVGGPHGGVWGNSDI